MKVDLHMHTSCSDGVYMPEQLISMAAAAGLDTIAITDHDTVDAYSGDYVLSGDVRIIRGIEISSEYKGEDVHILGYYIDPAHEAILSYASQFQERRRNRMRKIVEKCRTLGYVISSEDIAVMAKKNGTIGRPHIARILVKNAYFPSVKAVFDNLLYRNGPAYVGYSRFSIEQCIATIHAAGGVAVLAHPGLIKNNFEAVTAYPFDGIEIYHPDNKGRYGELQQLAVQRHWLVSGGSDFHGVPGRFPERVGGFRVESEWVEDLLEYR